MRQTFIQEKTRVLINFGLFLRNFLRGVNVHEMKCERKRTVHNTQTRTCKVNVVQTHAKTETLTKIDLRWCKPGLLMPQPRALALQERQVFPR